MLFIFTTNSNGHFWSSIFS